MCEGSSIEFMIISTCARTYFAQLYPFIRLQRNVTFERYSSYIRVALALWNSEDFTRQKHEIINIAPYNFVLI